MPDGRPIDNPELRPPKNAIPQRMLEQAYVTLTGLPPPYHIVSWLMINGTRLLMLRLRQPHIDPKYATGTICLLATLTREL